MIAAHSQVACSAVRHSASIIDLDADPFIPTGLEVVEHQKGGQLNWDASKVAFHFSTMNGGIVSGGELREELKGKSVYNANMLDYLLQNPHLIPEAWKGKFVVFLGTIYYRRYRREEGYYYVRYLCWHIDRWIWGRHWLDRIWYNSPIAMPAS